MQKRRQRLTRRKIDLHNHPRIDDLACGNGFATPEFSEILSFHTASTRSGHHQRRPMNEFHDEMLRYHFNGEIDHLNVFILGKMKNSDPVYRP